MLELDLEEGQKNLREAEDAFAEFEKEHKEHEEVIEEIRTRYPYMTEDQIELLAEVYRL